MGWNDRLGVGPGYSVGDMDLDEIQKWSDDELVSLLNQLEDCPDQAAAIQEILDARRGRDSRPATNA